jgi:hypothetical protein
MHGPPPPRRPTGVGPGGEVRKGSSGLRPHHAACPPIRACTLMRGALLPGRLHLSSASLLSSLSFPPVRSAVPIHDHHPWQFLSLSPSTSKSTRSTY